MIDINIILQHNSKGIKIGCESLPACCDASLPGPPVHPVISHCSFILAVPKPVQRAHGLAKSFDDLSCQYVVELT